MRIVVLLAAVLALGSSMFASADVPRDEWVRAVREIQDAFAFERFARLEELHGDFVLRRQLADDGTWMAEAFESAFDQMFPHAPLARLEGNFSTWKAAVPESRLRPVAEALMWQARARLALRAGCLTYDEAGRPLAARQLDRAQAALDAASASADSPLWFTAALRVAGMRRDSSGQLDALLARGEAAHPGYLPMQWARGRFLLPPFASDAVAFERFASDPSRRASTAGPDVAYALLHVSIARDTCADFLERSGVSWPRMKAGLEQLAQARPTAWNLNLFGTFACRFRDGPTTLEVAGRLGTAATFDLWSSGQSLRSCLDMARGAAKTPS